MKGGLAASRCEVLKHVEQSRLGEGILTFHVRSSMGVGWSKGALVEGEAGSAIDRPAIGKQGQPWRNASRRCRLSSSVS
jgi:hypothetical protein